MTTVLHRNISASRERQPNPPPRISSRARGRLALGALVVVIRVLINLATGVDDRSPCCS
jgi:hypothetical protein